MIRTALLGVLVLAAAACALPTPHVPRPEGGAFAGLAPPPPPAPAEFPWSGPLGPRERGDPPVVIVPATGPRESPEIGAGPELRGEGNAYGWAAPYGADEGFGRRR